MFILTLGTCVRSEALTIPVRLMGIVLTVLYTSLGVATAFET